MGDLRFYPERQGFDVNLGGCAMGGPFSFFDPYQLHNLPSKIPGQYMPDRFADELIRFVKQHSERPWLAFLWNYTVHWPMEAPDALIEKYKARGDLGRLDPRYAAMIEATDMALGRIFRTLKELQLEQETFVVFTSDNGAFDGVSDLAPLRKAKGYLYEGGIRVPLIIRWPGRAEAGRVCRTPVISMDFYPTILEAAGLVPSKSVPDDGVSLVPLLSGQSIDRNAIYFHYPNYAFHRSNRLGGAIRVGDEKLIERFDDGSLELYDLSRDIGEQENLAEKRPQRAAELQRKLAKWRQRCGAAMPSRVKTNDPPIE